MIQLVAMVVENVQHGIHAVNFLTAGMFMHDDFSGRGCNVTGQLLCAHLTGLSIHCRHTWKRSKSKHKRTHAAAKNEGPKKDMQLSP